MHCMNRQPGQSQRGVALVTGLIFLLLLTLLVVSLLRDATLEERMAANARSRQQALQAADAMLRDAEMFIETSGAPFSPFNPASFTTACSQGLCTRPATAATPRWRASGFDWHAATRTRTLASTGSLAGVASQPRFFIEIANIPVIGGAGPCPKVLYRITARGVGRDGNAEVVTQTLYRHLPAAC